MENKKDGGPAFPNVPNGAGDIWSEWDSGMTLRDYFAAKALHAVIDKVPAGTGLGVSYPGSTQGVARCAYSIADAMLKAREEWR